MIVYLYKVRCLLITFLLWILLFFVGSGSVCDYIVVSEEVPETIQVPPPANQGPMSGMLMKPTASSFVPKESGELDTKSSQEKATFNTDEDGLVNEDAKLTITAENRLLAATAFENMGIDPRFIRALLLLSFSVIVDTR